MNSDAAVTFWSADAFLTLSGTSLYKHLTAEHISRLSAFVDAYILFDKVRLPHRYSTRKTFDYLGGDTIFDFTPSEDVMHSDDLSSGITFDLNLSLIALPKIIDNDEYWSIQHNPQFFSEVCEALPGRIEGKTMSFLRLWQWCAMNEISEKFGASLLLPNSTIELEDYEKNENRDGDYIHELFKQFSNQHQERLISASRNYDDPYINTVRNFPPLLATLLDRAKNNEQLPEILKTMRNDYSDLRKTRERFASSISNANSIGEKCDITEEWSSSWEHLLKTEFKKTGLFSRKISSGDIVKMIFSPNNYPTILKFLAEQVLEFTQETKMTKQFKVFCQVARDSDSVYFNNDALYKKFGIEGVIDE